MAHKNEAVVNDSAQVRRFRLTPLNFASAGFFAMAIYIFINGAKIAGSPYEHFSGTIGWIFILFGVVVSLLDIIFRNFFPETKKLWVIELSFITLVAIIFLLVK